MKTDDKKERLLDMIEHPEQYTENEINRLLEDDECRAYYELMVKADNAYSSPTPPDTEKALKKFEAKHFHRFSWHSAAAIIIGIAMISGIAFATIALTRPSTEHKAKLETPVAKVAEQQSATQIATEKSDTLTIKEKSFDDVELQTILNELATYYNIKVEYRSESSKHLRLHFHWDKTQTIETVIETMNHFEKVTITLVDGKMEVE